MKWPSTTLSTLLSLCLLNGCTTLDPVQEDPQVMQVLDNLVVDVAPGDPRTEMLQLSDELKQQLEARVNPAWSDTQKFRELGKYFFDDDERNIQYDAWFTQTAEETFIAGRGNCLSMSSLFVAAARHLKVDSGFETVEVRPSWTHEAETMIRYEHIIAAGDLGGSRYVVDFLPQFMGKRGPRTKVTDEQALALYYSNLGAEAIISGDLDEGIYKSKQAIRLWPENSNVWSNLGAAYRRKGNSQLAEASYRRALSLDRNNYSALSNLTQFYLLEDRRDEAETYLKTVRRYYRRNPYYHVQLARTQVEAGDYRDARANLERATRLQNKDPALYDAVSHLYEKLADPAESIAAAAKADEIRERIRTQDHKVQELISPGELEW